MKSDFDKAKETLEKQGVKIELKALDSESSEFAAEHIKTLFDTLPSDNSSDIQYFTLNGKQATKDFLRDNGIVDFKIEHVPSGEFVTCKDCCPIYDNPYGEVRIPITKERDKINMKNFDAWYAYDLSHNNQQMDSEMAAYFQSKGIKTSEITATHIKQMRTDLKRPWHETTDGRAQLISRESHQRFRHPGGVSDAKFNIAMASRTEKLSSVDSSNLKSSSSRAGKLFGRADTATSGTSKNRGRIIIRIISLLLVLAMIIGTIVLLANVLPPVFDAIGNFFSSIGQFFSNMWTGIVEFFTGPAPDIDVNMPDFGDLGEDAGNIFEEFNPQFNKYELEFATTDGGQTYFVSNCKRTLLGTTDINLQIEIPETYNGSPVVGIGENAFEYMSHIKALKIPSSIKWIECSAFGTIYSRCAHIKEIHITDIEAWLSIEFGPNSGDYAALDTCHPFFGVGEEYREEYESSETEAGKLYLNGELVTNLVIPNGVTEIGEYAFFNCSSIKNVTIPSSVTHIGNNSFYGCINLESIDFNGTQNEWNERCGEYLFSYPCIIKCKDGIISITVE